MSFARAAQEVQALERQLEELTRAGKGKDLEIHRLQHPHETISPHVDDLLAQLCEGEELVVKVLTEFSDKHQSLEHGTLVLNMYGLEKQQALVKVICDRLSRENDDPLVVTELLRLARGLLRESRENCAQLCDKLLSLVVTRVAAEQHVKVREAAIRCMHSALHQNSAIRDKLVSDEKAIDQLTLALEKVAELVRYPELSSHSECARIFVAVKALFVGSHDENDKIVARMMLKSGFIPALIERVSQAFLEVADIETHQLIDGYGPVLSTTYEGNSRGTVLVDGFRFLYVTALFADEEMLNMLLQNEGKPTLTGQELENCYLNNPKLGVGDRYVFLQSQVTLVEANMDSISKDVDNLDVIKISVCSLLMFANRGTGFVAYLYRRGVAKSLFALLDRETSRAKRPGGHSDDLLPILIAIKTLVDDNDDFKEQFQDLFFESLRAEIDPSDYETEEEFKQAAEKRHFQGSSIPDTVFGKTVELLTSFHDHVKRYAGELLYYLCDEDPNKVTKLVGFGHAAHILAIKGGMLGQLGGQ